MEPYADINETVAVRRCVRLGTYPKNTPKPLLGIMGPI